MEKKITLYLIASTKHTIIGAVLKRALAVPAGMYLSGARNIETVRALQKILLHMMVKAKVNENFTGRLFNIESHAIKMNDNAVEQKKTKTSDS